MKKGESDKILKTVCGFANSEGGLFIYGIEEENGFPSNLKGIPINKSWDDEKRRIQDIINNHSEPPIHYEIEKIDLETSDNILLLIKIPKSWNSPHRVKQGNKLKEFYFRRDGRTDPLELNELRDLFNLKDKLTEQIKNFRDKRISNVYYTLKGSYKVLFHSIPLTAFSEQNININNAKTELSNIESIKGFYKPTFEGIYHETECNINQLYRNGIFEKIYFHYSEYKNVDLNEYEEEFKKFIRDIFKLYSKININSPIVFFITYTNIKDCNQKRNGIFTNRNKIFDKNRDVLPSKELILNHYDEEKINEEIKTIFNPFWNHFGYER